MYIYTERAHHKYSIKWCALQCMRHSANDDAFHILFYISAFFFLSSPSWYCFMSFDNTSSSHHHQCSSIWWMCQLESWHLTMELFSMAMPVGIELQQFIDNDLFHDNFMLQFKRSSPTAHSQRTSHNQATANTAGLQCIAIPHCSLLVRAASEITVRLRIHMFRMWRCGRIEVDGLNAAQPWTRIPWPLAECRLACMHAYAFKCYAVRMYMMWLLFVLRLRQAGTITVFL